MKTSGVEPILSALTGDSASVNGGKGPVGDSAAFNAAFDAAARSAEKNDNLKSDSNPSPLHGSSAIHDSEPGGNALPNNGKELPNTEGTSTAESVIAEGLAENSAPANALAPSPFMKAALDNAAAVITPEGPAGTPSQLSTSVKSQPMSAPATHTGLSPGTDSVVGHNSQSTPVPTSLTYAIDAQLRPGSSAAATVAAGPSMTTLGEGSAAAEAPRVPSNAPPMTGAVSVAPKVFDQELMAASTRAEGSSSHLTTGQNSPVMPRSAALASSGATVTEQLATPANTGDIGSTLSAAARGPSPRVSGTPMQKGDLGVSGDSAIQRTLGAKSDSQTRSVATANKTASGSESMRALPGEAFDIALDTSQARTNGFREGGIAVSSEVAPRAAEAPVTSLAGLNPTTRSAELTAANAATQVADFKASPNAADFPQEVLARVRMIQGQGGTEARLNLHPAELGRLQIAITSDGDATRVAFVVDNAQAKEALEQAMPRLREFLQQAGLQLAEGSVSQQGQQGSAGFAQNEARSGDTRSGISEGVDDDGVVTNTSDQPSDPNRIFDAYA
ncbi:flagellar hook-length control protein FliK [Luminiphilus sp.]|nr:flagellar hook-length control protein FliK [Luminiphilus sp.]